MQKFIKPAIIIAVILVILYFAISFINYETHKNELTLSGNVDIRQVDLGFRVAGRVAEMHFEEGDVVKAGAIMATLDQVPFQNDLQLAQAQLAEAEANLAKMEHGSRPEEIAQAQAKVKEQQAAYDNANTLFLRQQQLAQAGAISKQDFDNAVAQKKEAYESLQVAQEALALSEAGFRSEDIDAAQASLLAATAQVEIAQTNLADAAILAPNDGYIFTRILEPGAIVNAGTAVYSLSLEKPTWVRAYVSEPYLGRIKPGMKVQIFTDSYPEPLNGQIGYISPQAEFTPKNIETKELRTSLVYRIRITVDDPQHKLRQGMPVTVKINLAQKNG